MRYNDIISDTVEKMRTSSEDIVAQSAKRLSSTANWLRRHGIIDNSILSLNDDDLYSSLTDEEYVNNNPRIRPYTAIMRDFMKKSDN